MKTLKRNTKVVLEGRGSVILRPSNYITTGGEGSVYRLGNTVVKLYTDSRKMQREDMQGKIKLLSQLKHDYIVAPRGSVLKENGTPIGFYMNYVNGEPLPRVFTNGFRNREGFSDKDAIILTDRMREVVQFAHGNKAILADANELNWMMSISQKKEPEPRVIDVDSWSIGKWPASVIMPSIKDWHSLKIGEQSDWFAWSIVTFQVFTGIHPYKGKAQGFKQGDFESRMKANISVFAPKVRLNRAVRDFNVIPRPLLDWYVETFQNGERSVPPSPFQKGGSLAKAARVLHVVSTPSGVLVHQKLFGDTNNPVRRIFTCGLALLESGKLVDISSSREIAKQVSLSSEVVEVDGGWLVCDIGNGNLSCRYVNKTSMDETELSVEIKGTRILRSENRLFVVTSQGLSEIICTVLGKPLLSVAHSWGAVTSSTRWFDGVGIQDGMGASYLILPFGKDACAHVRVSELDELKPIFAKAGNRFVSIVAIDKSGQYKKLEFSLDRNYKSYTLWQASTDSPELNIAILHKGVCATIVNDGEFDIFVPTTKTLNKIKDSSITTDMNLASLEDKVVYVLDGNIWSISMK